MSLAPEDLIARHIKKLTAQNGAREKMDRVLERCGLGESGGRVTSPRGEITTSDCENYKRAVKEVFGDAVYSFAKVNFVLGGCSCRDCAAGT